MITASLSPRTAAPAPHALAKAPLARAPLSAPRLAQARTAPSPLTMPPPQALRGPQPFTTVAALNPPQVPQPPGSAHAQREAIWRDMQRTAYTTLPDPNRVFDDPYALFGNTQTHNLSVRLGDRWREVLSAPFWLGFAGLLRGSNEGRALMARVAAVVGHGEELGKLGETAGAIVGCILLGAAGTASMPLLAAAYAALDTTRLAQQLAKPPRALVAKAAWKPSVKGAYGGLFKSGAPALFSIIEGRFGPMLRLQVFVDGQQPITLSTRDEPSARSAARLAHLLPNGVRTPGASPEQLYVQLWDIFGDPRNIDWRQAAMEGARPGEELAYLHEGSMTFRGSPNTGNPGPIHPEDDDGLGHIVAETPFVASQYGDDHI